MSKRFNIKEWQDKYLIESGSPKNTRYWKKIVPYLIKKFPGATEEDIEDVIIYDRDDNLWSKKINALFMSKDRDKMEKELKYTQRDEDDFHDRL